MTFNICFGILSALLDLQCNDSFLLRTLRNYNCQDPVHRWRMIMSMHNPGWHYHSSSVSGSPSSLGRWVGSFSPPAALGVGMLCNLLWPRCMSGSTMGWVSSLWLRTCLVMWRCPETQAPGDELPCNVVCCLSCGRVKETLLLDFSFFLNHSII